MSKKELDKITKACEKTKPKRKSDLGLITMFALGFETTDINTSMRGGKVYVTTRIDKEQFDKIIYSYGVYILNYLKEKGLVK